MASDTFLIFEAMTEAKWYSSVKKHWTLSKNLNDLKQNLLRHTGQEFLDNCVKHSNLKQQFVSILDIKEVQEHLFHSFFFLPTPSLLLN